MSCRRRLVAFAEVLDGRGTSGRVGAPSRGSASGRAGAPGGAGHPAGEAHPAGQGHPAEQGTRQGRRSRQGRGTLNVAAASAFGVRVASSINRFNAAWGPSEVGPAAVFRRQWRTGTPPFDTDSTQLWDRPKSALPRRFGVNEGRPHRHLTQIQRSLGTTRSRPCLGVSASTEGCK